MNLAAARLARKAADAGQDRNGQPVLVAGSIGPTGELFAPMGALDHDAARAAFTEQAEALAEGGVDLLWVETMSSLEEVKAAIDAAAATGLEVAVCMTFDTAARSMMGITPADFACRSAEFGAACIGANCGIGPAELLHSVREMLPVVETPVIAKGNCGIPEYVDGGIHYHGTPDLMAEYACLARDAGISIIGGCCGTTPDHVAALGTPWKDVPTPDETRPRGGAGQLGRRRRRGRD